MIEDIWNRRSIRKFKIKEVTKDLIIKILEAGRQAPSAKNRQPWHFVVVSGKSKQDCLRILQQGLSRELMQPLLPNYVKYINGARNSFKIMQEAPILIFIVNTLAKEYRDFLDFEEHIAEICDVQSIGASIQNMLLTANNLGLGSLWIGDIFFVYPELKRWLNTKGEVIACLALGYADEEPLARPREELKKIVEWRE